MKENSFFKMIRELKDFLLLWASQAVSELGTAMTNYALTIWVYQQKGTSSSVTMLTLCTSSFASLRVRWWIVGIKSALCCFPILLRRWAQRRSLCCFPVKSWK